MRIFATIFIALFGVGCASGKKVGDIAAYYAMAILHPTADSKVSGRVFFTEAFGSLKIKVEVQGLDANSQHAIHVREFGDCTSQDGLSAGDHFNPLLAAHGGLESEIRHAGDLGNIKANKRGIANAIIEVKQLSINGSVNPIIGRSVVIMKNADDLESQPNGGDTKRLACGVIGIAEKPK